MTAHNAIYHLNEEEHKAELSFLKEKLCISLSDNRKVFWHYREIIRENVYSFKYTTYPPQLLQVSSSAVADELERLIQKGKQMPNAGKLAPLLKVLVVFLLIAIIAYVLIVPWVASALASRFPVSYEKSIGDKAYHSIKKSLVVDEQRTQLINDFFSKLDIPSRYNVQITVVKGDMMNAFAMPGGHIVVYDKIINGMSSYPELAALLSHEFTHVENRHTIRTLFRQLGSKVFLSLVLGDATAVGGVIVNNADDLKHLSYSRSLETEADRYGVRLLAERHIDPLGFVRLFQLLKKETPAAPTSEWMSSHPDLNKRIEGIKNNIFYKDANSKSDSSLHHLFLQLQTAD